LFDEPVMPADTASVHKPEEEVAVIDARGPLRAAGPRYGELVHALLATAALTAARANIDALAEVQGRVLAAPADEVSAAADTVERLLAHDVLRRARSAEARGACRRETPVTLAMADGVLVEGVVDLAFEESGRWIVVDYKTDRELEADGEGRYRRQVALYASAIARATGVAAAGLLIRI